MKCAACDYEYTTKWDDAGWCFLPDIGDTPFIPIDGNFTTEKRGNWQTYIDRISLYACPKCGTIKTPINEC